MNPSVQIKYLKELNFGNLLIVDSNVKCPSFYPKKVMDVQVNVNLILVDCLTILLKSANSQNMCLLII